MIHHLQAIRELLSIRIDPEHHTCQESKGIVQARLSEVEARINEHCRYWRLAQGPRGSNSKRCCELCRSRRR
jgi:DNA-binding transcriptional MerR regulator